MKKKTSRLCHNITQSDAMKKIICVIISLGTIRYLLYVTASKWPNSSLKWYSAMSNCF